jgi:Icc-related predicted phosphoesterase
VTRVAAVGDVHFGLDAAGTFGARYARVAEDADALLLAGDLTRRGTRPEADGLVAELSAIEVPIVAVLGNHDLESDEDAYLRACLERMGVTVLEGEATVLELEGCRVGIAGTIGFGGGFPGGTCADFGEAENKAFMARSRRLAASLEQALDGLVDVEVRIALTHYAPVRATLEGENPEIFPFLGSHLLADAVDRGRGDLALHGHAHHGAERGRTPGGVPVRNVSRPVLGGPYRVFDLRRLREQAA